MLLEEHRLWISQLEAVEKAIVQTVLKVDHVEKLLAIKGVGVITIAGFIAEVGDIRRFKSPKQIQKYAGLELVENSSGKHKGRSRISKRGRRKLRRILYQVMIPLLASNKEFRGIYDYYVTRVKNPLKRRQAMIAVSCKLIRVFYAVLTKGMDYDRFKMMSDIHRNSELIAA
jgi:transposase